MKLMDLFFPLRRGLGGGKNENPKFSRHFLASAIKAFFETLDLRPKILD
jgi:hypothetical protein